jgi:hypothetical protein
MQHEYARGGENFVVKKGVTYRQAKELGQASKGLEHQWGNHQPWNARINVALQRNAGRRAAERKERR